MIDAQQVKNIIEACLLVAGKAMSLRQLDELFEGDENRPDKETIKTCIEQLQTDYEGRGIELVQVASGYRLQSRAELSEWVARLFPEKPPRYSRALLETLVLVAYRQPITRGEIEEIRGVAVSSNIVKTLQERQWVKEVGFKDVPGKPALLGTTKHFLDYFNLKRLDDLPPLSEIKNLDEMDAALMEAAGIAPAQDMEAANDGETPDGVSADALDNAVRLDTTADAENAVSADDSTDTHVEASADAEGQTEADDGQISDSVEEAVVEVSADESASVETASENSTTQIDETSADAEDVTAGATVVATDDNDAPVTFAGLVSDLPPLEKEDSDGELATRDDESEESTQPSSTDQLSSSSLADDTHGEERSAEVLENSSSTPSEEERELYSKLSEYAEEHQKDVDARDELDNHLQTRYIDREVSETADSVSSDDSGISTEAELVTADADEQENSSTADSLGDAIDASSTSIDVLSDTFTGDSAGVGETLH